MEPATSRKASGSSTRPSVMLPLASKAPQSGSLPHIEVNDSFAALHSAQQPPPARRVPQVQLPLAHKAPAAAGPVSSRRAPSFDAHPFEGNDAGDVDDDAYGWPAAGMAAPPASRPQMPRSPFANGPDDYDRARMESLEDAMLGDSWEGGAATAGGGFAKPRPATAAPMAPAPSHQHNSQMFQQHSSLVHADASPGGLFDDESEWGDADASMAPLGPQQQQQQRCAHNGMRAAVSGGPRAVSGVYGDEYDDAGEEEEEEEGEGGGRPQKQITSSFVRSLFHQQQAAQPSAMKAKQQAAASKQSSAEGATPRRLNLSCILFYIA